MADVWQSTNYTSKDGISFLLKWKTKNKNKSAQSGAVAVSIGMSVDYFMIIFFILTLMSFSKWLAARNDLKIVTSHLILSPENCPFIFGTLSSSITKNNIMKSSFTKHLAFTSLLRKQIGCRIRVLENSEFIMVW